MKVANLLRRIGWTMILVGGAVVFAAWAPSPYWESFAAVIGAVMAVAGFITMSVGIFDQ